MKTSRIWTFMSAAVILVTATPSIADYYIVRESAAAPYRIVESRPTDADTIVGGDRNYATRAEAEKEMPLLCKSA
jgi:hypothetical protein